MDPRRAQAIYPRNEGWRALALLLVLWGTACAEGGTRDRPDPLDACSEQAAVETIGVGTTRSGANGAELELVALDPDPVARFENTWEVRVTDAQGVARDDASLRISPWMPSHRHGSGRAVTVTPRGNGLYTLTPIDLWMPGYWEVRLDLELDGVPDFAVFSVCVRE